MDQSQTAFTIRKGRPEDAVAIHRLIVELAIYERAENEVTTTVEQLVEDGFGSDAIYRLFVAEVQGAVVGMALWYEKYSTWKGRCGFLKTSWCGSRTGAKASARRCFWQWLKRVPRQITAGWNGKCWIGTSRRLGFTNRLVPDWIRSGSMGS